MSANRTLILVTSMYPFGTGETFIENEFPYLESHFDKILIVTNHDKTGPSRLDLQVTKKVSVFTFPYQLTGAEKLKSLFHIKSREVKNELEILKSNYKLKSSKSILKTALISYQKSLKIKKYLKQLLNDEVEAQDQVVIYSYWMNDMAVGVAQLANEFPAIKTVCRAHGWDVYFERHTDRYLPFRSFILENISGCYPIAQDGVNYLNHLTVNKFEAKINLARLGTKALSLEEKEERDAIFQIVSCSNLIPLKRVHLIIRALAEIDFPVNWIHFGDGSLRKELESLAIELLTEKSNVHFSFKGQVSNDEVRKHYETEQVDLFVNVSETEGVPVSIMEAMSAKIPCVATNVGGNSEIVNASNGIVLNANTTVSEIAEAVRSIHRLSDQDFNDLKQEAYETWKGKYSAEVNYLRFIEEIC